MKIALIGNGYWGSKIKNYIPEFFELKYTAGSEFNKDIIWNDADVKAVIIATPIKTHYRIAKDALLNNKHVFCEKPITLCSIQAEKLKEIAEKRNLKICVDYTYTFSPFLTNLSGIVDYFIDLEYIEMNTKRLGRFMEYDVYWLLASHHLSILDMIVDINTLSFEFKDHIFNGSVCTTGSILFKKGKIDVSLNFNEKRTSINYYGANWLIKYRPLEDKRELVTYNRTHKRLADDLVLCTATKTIDEQNNIRHALKYFKDLIGGKVKSNIDRAIKITKILERR